MEFIGVILEHWEFVFVGGAILANAGIRIYQKITNKEPCEHLVSFMAEIRGEIKGQKILAMLALTPPNCSIARFDVIVREYDEYTKDGKNGYVTEYFVDWCERRENSLKNLKQNKK